MALTALAPEQPPAIVGLCAYCGEPLYQDAPTSMLDEPLSHVGCAVDARRRGIRQ